MTFEGKVYYDSVILQILVQKVNEDMKKYEIGKYYVCLKGTHIEWKRKSGPRGKQGEAYLPIPAKFAYLYGIKKGEVFSCKVEETGTRFDLKAEGSQGRREYAKQFAGNGSLSTLYSWYKEINAVEGDYIVVTVYSNNTMTIQHISHNQQERISRMGLVGYSGRPILYSYEKKEDWGFKLISLLVRNGEDVICDMSFMREGFTPDDSCPMTSLIIGANGTGKSTALKYITEIINACLNTGGKKAMQYSFYCIDYFLGNQRVEIVVSNNTVLLSCNGRVVEEQYSLYLPQRVLAIAFMLNDKFVYKAQGASEIYEYLGIRMASNAAWTNSLSNRVAENIIDIAVNNKLVELIDSLSKYLQLDPRFSIVFDKGDEKTNYEIMSIEEIEIIVQGAIKRVIGKNDYRSDAIKKIDSERVKKLACFLKYKAWRTIPVVLKTVRKGLWIEEKEIDNNQSLREDYASIRILSLIGLIRNYELCLYKGGVGYLFEESSSGEKHILYVLTSIARYICDNSLVLIDEPEISLHPNWQMKYIHFLKHIFEKYSTCHFVIASHSPYLVSDLAPESSSLISMRIENNARISETIDYDTYAWSAENVLYNVFGVRTTRNYYFYMDLQELLHNMSQGENLDRVKELYKKISGYVLNDNDPLNLILSNVKEYIQNAES